MPRAAAAVLRGVPPRLPAAAEKIVGTQRMRPREENNVGTCRGASETVGTH